MKLNTIKEAGHWEVPDINYPGDITKGIKKRKSSRPLSFLVDPEDREEFFDGVTMGLKEDALSNITKDITELPKDPKQEVKSDSVNNKAEKDRLKRQQSQVLPRLNQIQKNATTIQKSLKDRASQAKSDQKSYNDLNKNVDNMAKSFIDITKAIK